VGGPALCRTFPTFRPRTGNSRHAANQRRALPTRLSTEVVTRKRFRRRPGHVRRAGAILVRSPLFHRFPPRWRRGRLVEPVRYEPSRVRSNPPTHWTGNWNNFTGSSVLVVRWIENDPPTTWQSKSPLFAPTRSYSTNCTLSSQSNCLKMKMTFRNLSSRHRFGCSFGMSSFTKNIDHYFLFFEANVVSFCLCLFNVFW